MKCPKCGHTVSFVRDTKQVADTITRRYRVCRHCAYSYVTQEHVAVFNNDIKSYLVATAHE